MMRRKAMKNNSAQASIEVTLSLICVFLLLFGSFKIFVWMNKRMISRHNDYQVDRVDAASTQTNSGNSFQVDESGYKPLNIFEIPDSGS